MDIIAVGEWSFALKNHAATGILFNAVDQLTLCVERSCEVQVQSFQDFSIDVNEVLVTLLHVYV